MGKRKVDPCEYIQEDNRRYVTYSKRLRGMLKKCIEFSKMCDQDISMIIFDKTRQKLVQYSSDENFTPRLAASLVHENYIKMLTFKRFNNDDYEKITSIKTKMDNDSVLSDAEKP